MQLSIYIPKRIARFLFPKIFGDLERRSMVVGSAGKTLHEHDGNLMSVSVHAVVSEEDKIK